MSSNGFLLTLELAPVSRRVIVACQLAAGCASAAAIAIAEAPAFVQCLFVAALAAGIRCSMPRGVKRLVWPPKGPARLFFRDGSAGMAELVDGWIFGRVAGLRWRVDDGRTHAIFVYAASLARDDWRRLRARLWLGGPLGDHR